ncbi:hypothetical protein [Stieleria mannarensis]|uniref:hypothetical protein n=1 Tax=Stieleria mannarensis TaxID=2755585 RepID=UPI002570FAEB|nr:hypothetical protein [Rhodopirellula sp. JC639]
MYVRSARSRFAVNVRLKSQTITPPTMTISNANDAPAAHQPRCLRIHFPALILSDGGAAAITSPARCRRMSSTNIAAD